MVIEEALTKLLSSAAYLNGNAERIAAQVQLEAMLGAKANGNLDRFYPGPLPQPPIYTAVTYQLITSPLVQSHSGSSGLRFSRIQLTAWAKSYGAASAVVATLQAVLTGYRGMVDTIRIDGISIEPDRTDYEPTTAVHQRNFDIIVTHTIDNP